MLHILHCETCRQDMHVALGPRVYRVLEGGHIFVRSQVGWCKECRLFVPMEECPTLAALDKDIVRLSERSDRPEAPTVDGLLVGLDAARVRRKWRERRQSPERCLECGGIRVVAVPIPQGTAGDGVVEGIAHEDCGGRLRVGYGLITYQSPSVYDEEGRCLEVERL